MEKEKDRYGEVRSLLKKSGPVLKDPGEIENNVMRIIANSQRSGRGTINLLEVLYGWVYVGWIRRSLITASVFLAGFFIFQQGIILKKINNIEQQSGYRLTTYPPVQGQIYSGSYAARVAGLKFLRSSNKLTGADVGKLLDSYNELETKYRDILRTINDDPELKKYFDEKLPGFDKDRIKL